MTERNRECVRCGNKFTGPEPSGVPASWQPVCLGCLCTDGGPSDGGDMTADERARRHLELLQTEQREAHAAWIRKQLPFMMRLVRRRGGSVEWEEGGARLRFELAARHPTPSGRAPRQRSTHKRNKAKYFDHSATPSDLRVELNKLEPSHELGYLRCSGDDVLHLVHALQDKSVVSIAGGSLQIPRTGGDHLCLVEMRHSLSPRMSPDGDLKKKWFEIESGEILLSTSAIDMLARAGDVLLAYCGNTAKLGALVGRLHDVVRPSD